VSSQESRVWAKVLNDGVICCDLQELDVLEGELTYSLTDESHRQAYEDAAFLINPLSRLIVPKGFIGKITNIHVCLGDSPFTSLDSYPRRISRHISTVEQLDISASYTSTGYGNVGNASMTAWYYVTAHGKYHEPTQYPIRRIVTPITWDKAADFPKIIRQLKKTSTLSEGAEGRQRINNRKTRSSGDPAQQYET
jgi:hypothetical protein